MIVGAEKLADKILEVTEPLNPNMKLVLQNYDGASIMSGHISGVQTRIREKIPTLIYIHCMGHEVSISFLLTR